MHWDTAPSAPTLAAAAAAVQLAQPFLASVFLCLRGRVPRPGFEREATTSSPGNCRHPLARATFDDRPAEISMCRLPPPFFSLSSRSCPSSPPPLPNLPGVSSLGGRAAFALSSSMPNTPLLQAVGHPGQSAHISMRSALRSEGGEQVQRQISRERESRGGLDRKSTMQVWHGCSNIRGGHHTLDFFYFLSSLSLSTRTGLWEKSSESMKAHHSGPRQTNSAAATP